jgi:hypothetical protein
MTGVLTVLLCFLLQITWGWVTYKEWSFIWLMGLQSGKSKRLVWHLCIWGGFLLHYNMVEVITWSDRAMCQLRSLFLSYKVTNAILGAHPHDLPDYLPKIPTPNVNSGFRDSVPNTWILGHKHSNHSTKRKRTFGQRHSHFLRSGVHMHIFLFFFNSFTNTVYFNGQTMSV